MGERERGIGRAEPISARPISDYRAIGCRPFEISRVLLFSFSPFLSLRPGCKTDKTPVDSVSSLRSRFLRLGLRSYFLNRPPRASRVSALPGASARPMGEIGDLVAAFAILYHPRDNKKRKRRRAFRLSPTSVF